MIALDTNVLVRYLVADEPAQAKRAAAIVDRARDDEESIHLSQIALCELVWVLAGAYDAAKKDILYTLNLLSDDSLFICDDPSRVRRAIDRFAEGSADFSDYLLGETSSDAGAGVTYTFDKSLRDESGFTLLR